MASVKARKTDWNTGQAVNTRNSSRNGIESNQAALACRVRPADLRRAGTAARRGGAGVALM
ncbi:hypothetical protein GCM10027067_35010 [Pseudactinotalea suaedae]